jgi:Outer membrane protein
MAGAMDEAVKSMTGHVKEATAFHDQKIVPKLDLLRAKEKLADLRQQQLYAHNNVDLAQTALNYVLGVDMDTRYTYDDTPRTLPMPRDLETCIEISLENRPEIGAVEAQIRMANEQVAIAQSDYLPTLALVGEAHHYEPENEDPSAQIGIVASIDLFDNGRTSHKKAQAARGLKKPGSQKSSCSGAFAWRWRNHITMPGPLLNPLMWPKNPWIRPWKPWMQPGPATGWG